ncbi:MAG: hypothetical protein KJ583_01755 [Nanoarchaeota archaeon]|nr:hypothetical protein [Nanoarchaeota archaeon]MBU1269716.1 hypothetical protein [Nanoarchaeota archaeon]MBU1604017.1 hypothetical protein [Nanoarchaeota archaeon]
MDIFFFDGKNIVFTQELKDINKNRLNWIRFLEYSEEKIKSLSEFTGIPAEEFSNFFKFEERSRLEQGRFLELTYESPFNEKDEIKTIPINIFIIGNLFITVEKEKIVTIEQTASLMKNNKLRFLFKRTIGEFLYYFLDKINDNFLHSIDKIANLTDVLESKGAHVSNEQLMKLYNYNVTLTHFNQALMANLEVLAGLKKSYFKKFTKENLELFNDLYYEKLQILDTEKVQREVITNLFNFQTLVATHKLNNFMKKLTSLALIIMIPTLITGLFGMNLKVPFADSEYGFFIVTGFMVLFAVIMFVIFKKTEWL